VCWRCAQRVYRNLKVYPRALHDALPISRVRARVPGLRARDLARSAVLVPADTPLAEADRCAAEAGVNTIVAVDAADTPLSIVHRSEEHTSELQSRFDLVYRLLLEKKKQV